MADENVEQGLVVDDTGFEDITGEDEVEVVDEPIVEEPVNEPETEVAPEIDEGIEPEVDQGTELEQEVAPDEPLVDDVVVDDAGVDDSVGDVDEVAALREQNEALLAHVESLSSQVVGGVVQPPAVATPTDQPATSDVAPGVVPQTASEIQNYLGDVSIDDLLEDPAKFNAVLNNVAQQSQNAGAQQAVQQVLRSVPELVMGYITRHSAMNRMVDDFYKENPDLDNVKQTVAAVANDVHAKNPQLGVEDVFKQSAEQTRKLLGIKQTAQKAKRPARQKPAFAKSAGARQKAPAMDPIQREINDLLLDDF